MSFSKKEQRNVLFAVSIGNLLEWYEIYLYVYWAPIIGKLFFQQDNSDGGISSLTKTFLIFAMGFLARPIGGLFFGRLGDLVGRKKSLILSLIIMVIPTFVTGLLPTYEQIGKYAPFILVAMRILQSFPAGGELPGAFCYLYESSKATNRRFFCSWGAFGYQIGILISTLECFLLERFLSVEDLIQWGWRFSFLVGGLIGLCGLYLRYKLHETPLYREMETHLKVVREPILGVLYKYKRQIFMGILFCALNSSSFYLLSVNFPVLFGKVLGTPYSSNLIVTSLLIILVTVPLPLFGMLADRYDNKKILISSTIAILVLLYPLYLSITYSSVVFMGIIMLLFSLLFTCLSALIPFILADLFPTYVRFTCVGVSFNMVDAVIGGFTPVIALYLLNITGKDASFCWFLMICALLSLCGYLMMKKKHPIEDKTNT
ncbi:MAG: MFS transporter [Chlamydiales bacterium]|nr:MFS transporter [Chlamydiales bacterium]